MQAVKLFFYAAIALAVAFIVYRVFKFGDTIADAGKKSFEAVKTTVTPYVSPDGQSPLGNPVSRWISSWFKSDAEKAVDDMYGDQTMRPKGKPVNTPNDNSSPINFYNPDVYSGTVNAYPPNDPTLPPLRKSDITGDGGNYGRANGTPAGSTHPISNNAPENNDTYFAFPY